MINVIFNDINSKMEQFQKKKPQEYLRLFKEGFRQRLDSIKIVKGYKEDEDN